VRNKEEFGELIKIFGDSSDTCLARRMPPTSTNDDNKKSFFTFVGE
jgi:hypothetical protein